MQSCRLSHCGLLHPRPPWGSGVGWGSRAVGAWPRPRKAWIKIAVNKIKKNKYWAIIEGREIYFTHSRRWLNSGCPRNQYVITDVQASRSIRLPPASARLYPHRHPHPPKTNVSAVQRSARDQEKESEIKELKQKSRTQGSSFISPVKGLCFGTFFGFGSAVRSQLRSEVKIVRSGRRLEPLPASQRLTCWLLVLKYGQLNTALPRHCVKNVEWFIHIVIKGPVCRIYMQV